MIYTVSNKNKYVVCLKYSQFNISWDTNLRATSLPPGTQYEGIEKLAENVLTIRIMNGVEVVTMDCGVNPDGSLRSTGE